MNAAVKTAIETLNKIEARETFAHRPTMLAIVRVTPKFKRDGSERLGFTVEAQGIPSPILVWESDVPAMREATARARRNEFGFPVVNVLLSAKQTEARKVGTRTVPGYYNLSAMPLVADVEDFFG